MSLISEKSQLFPPVIFLTTLLLSVSFCSGQNYCTGFSESQPEGIECLVIETETPCPSSNYFSPGTALKFRCKPGYRPLTSVFRTGILWYHSTCLENNKWTNNDIRNFACEVEYGFFESLSVQPLISRGAKIDPKSAPWNSAIFVTDYTSGQLNYMFICGGTLIRPSFVLTAAHCLFRNSDLIPTSDFKIVLSGSTTVFDDVILQNHVQLFDVRESYMHPDYIGRDTNFQDDIALLELVGKASISSFTLPIKLPTAEQAQKIKESSWTMQVNGLGFTDNEKTAAKALYGLNVTSKSEECENFYAEHRSLSNREKTLCVTPVTDSGICNGDSGSGGFVAWPTPESPYFYIQGIVSAGFNPDNKDCNRITLFTNVFLYMDFIGGIVQNRKVPTTSTTNPPTTTTTTRTTSQTTTTSAPRFIYQLGVDLHNDYRRRHGSPDLIPDAVVQQAAREHCIYLSNTYFLTTRQGSPFGQNLYQFQGPYMSDDDIITKAVNYWYINNYNWNYPPFSSTSTFTQMVWRSTRFLGIHVERRGDRTVVVAMYSPKGNIDGQFQANVLPPQGGSQFTSQPPSIIQQTTSSTGLIVNPPVAKDWQTFGLQLHNDVRRKYGVSPMELDQQLINEAQAYADYIVKTNYNLSPKQGSPYGQNTFQNTGKSLDPATAIRKAFDSWYSGASQYNYQYPLQSSASAQLFTQIVWKSSNRLGLGVASQADRTIVIAFYSPAGNVASEQSYRENVFQLYA